MENKNAFSLVEIIITISIIILLAVVWISSNQWYNDKSDNTKIVSDIQTLNNALESYQQENKILPQPQWNINFFKRAWTYSHSYEDTETFWVYGSFTEDTIPKRYIQMLPLDPRTNSYYSYWKTTSNVDKLVSNQFEIAWVQKTDWEYQAFVLWNYRAEVWPYNLIREYNGSNFVYNRSKTNLPYNPEELILTATVNGEVKREWDIIEATTWDLEIFFSDGSVSVLEQWWKLTLTKLSFPKEDNLNTLVKLSLWAWTIWTKATHLNDESEFEVYTTDSTAAVRWTIFWVSKDEVWDTEILVLDWKVAVLKNDEQKTEIVVLEKNEKASIVNEVKTADTTNRIWTIDESKFNVQVDIRGEETVMNNESDRVKRIEEEEETPIESESTEWTESSTWNEQSDTEDSREQTPTEPEEETEDEPREEEVIVQNCEAQTYMNNNIPFNIPALNNWDSSDDIFSERISIAHWSQLYKLKVQCIDRDLHKTDEDITDTYCYDGYENINHTCVEDRSCEIAGITGVKNSANKCIVEFNWNQLIPNQDNYKVFENVSVKVWGNIYNNVNKIKNTYTNERIVKELKLFWPSKYLNMNSVTKIEIIK